MAYVADAPGVKRACLRDSIKPVWVDKFKKQWINY